MPRKSSRKKVRAFIQDLKTRSVCLDCGGSEELTFDHRPGEIKRFDIAQGPKYSMSLVISEISKCQIVCIPCHRQREELRATDPGFHDNKKMMEAVCHLFRLFSILSGNEDAYKEYRDIYREKEKKKKDRSRYRRNKKVKVDSSESSLL